MNQYVTGAIIKKHREEKNLTQVQLAGLLNVSEKTISKWETGRGYPDITLLEDLSSSLGLSVAELLSGEDIINNNRNFNMRRLKWYVCPVCGNIIAAVGEALVSCCGITLPFLEAENIDNLDETEAPDIYVVEDEYFISIPHEMTKSHYISFIAAVKDDGYEIKKLYPEGNAEARFKIARTKEILYYCNRHGLLKIRTKRARK